ncbi:MAG: DUF2147 domain-containing protein [Bacteroidetes bacterium]|nr:DUF2147 domain-containing protein [Bacteroidota bacterium]
MKKLHLILAFIYTVSIQCVSAQNTSEGDKIIGVWEVGSGKARVKISKYGEKYAGKIVWLKEPNYPDGTPKIDKNNPNEKERSRPLLGYPMLLGFVYEGKDTYKEGTIYDPENGSNYNCEIKMTDENTLEVRGYIGVSLLGRTDIWKRLVIKQK